VECAASLDKPARVIVASSADVYGRPPASAMPLREDQPPAPENPYAVTKLAAEHLARVYGQRLGVPVVVVRPFTQVGPGQLMHFAASYFAHEVARVEAGLGDVLRHGDLDAARDFTDVRDAARAYRLLAENDAAEGPFNLCSGRSRLVGDLLELLLGMAAVPVACELDPRRQRAEHCHEFRGDATRLHEATGWTPSIPLEQTLRDLLEEHREYFRLQVAAEQPGE
jgi:GDP-4-dehydro-6-deoxy-D-mannose reductase